jgi:plastocyanin
MNVVSVFLRSSLLVFSVIFFNGCSSSSEEKTPPPPESEQKTAPSLYIVQIEQMKFLPADISVHVGDTIMWMNNDMVAHDVTEEKSNAWTSSLLQPGQSWKLVVTTGADYYCSIHQVMKGSFEIK